MDFRQQSYDQINERDQRCGNEKPNKRRKRTKRKLNPVEKAQKQMDNFYPTITKLLKKELIKYILKKHHQREHPNLKRRIAKFPENKNFF